MIDAKRALVGYFAVLGLLWVSSEAVDRFLPSWLWFEVREVYVSNAVEGEWPKMRVVRIIRLPFWADWRVELEKFNSDGGWEFKCSSHGSNSYDVDNVLPKDLDLSWWMGNFCGGRDDASFSPPPPGRYRIVTSWNTHFWSLSPRRVTRLSNAFVVYPKP